jgi:uncharacterized protein
VIHPDTELQLVDPRVGMGVVATRRIPKGTITWVHDEMDQTLSLEEVARLRDMFRPTFEKYAYLEGSGRYVLCWDHGRFVNHSCQPTCMAPGFDFEIAIRNIEPGEQLTGDYATYNLETGFECFCGTKDCRGRIEPLREAFLLLNTVEQPLWELVREKESVERALTDRSRIPTCRVHFFESLQVESLQVER